MYAKVREKKKPVAIVNKNAEASIALSAEDAGVRSKVRDILKPELVDDKTTEFPIRSEEVLQKKKDDVAEE